MRPALIFDTSALFNFGHRDDLTGLLPWLAEAHDLLIPPRVQDEVSPETRYDYAALCEQCFQVRMPRPPEHIADALLRLKSPLGDGELAVLALTAELGDLATAVVDERRARTYAVDLNISVTGTLGLMQCAVDAGQLQDAQALVCVRALHANKFSIANPAGCESFEQYLNSISQP